ncbi:MAG: glycosyl hydrolase [Bacteroidetes bacterium]|jgi:photosystem II stability/assembly factor-like uncharacterized protein|nr:glycosyl hydrolase [Bacteroidota bacterium]
MKPSHLLYLAIGMLLCLPAGFAQKKSAEKKVFKAETFAGLEFRSIGPALMSGRIADIVIHPEDENTWYVAVGSGGIWKTTNSGTTWAAIFEEQGAYSMGCLALDPSNPEVIWAGTGENVGGRHVGYGDGIYRSADGGKSWKNKGLKNSEHLSKIIIHPNDPNTLWVAAQGPLWSKGGERGVFKTTDGGASWKQVLGDQEWTGATDLVIDPRHPDRLYAATWQRHRTIAAYMGGGPNTAIYRSEDGGESWEKLSSGLPKGNMGKIGLAISPQEPDVVYAAIELDRRSGGIFRSENRGAHWQKMSDEVAGGTGPHYYQELYASPHQFDKIMLMDVRLQVSDDGGKTFKPMHHRNVHVDNHAIAFRKSDPDYVLLGNDGGLYESFDKMAHWQFVANLPVTQFYKVAVDDDLPFYNVYGGTQDNNTQGGPSRTDNIHGIRNADWQIILGGDGHQPATEPGNPDILYAQWQQGNLMRYDRKTGEIVYIKPQPGIDEVPERYNWDAPILVSPHDPKRLYFASQRVWKSEDRGDSWEAISGDLTRNQERVQLPLMDQNWGWDAPWDMYAMSDYNSITSLSESPLKAGLIYAGTDDGLLQVTEDGGLNWRKIEVGSLPGLPKTAFVNDIKADLIDENKVYVVLDNHKFGDFEPYAYVSHDKGNSWKSISAGLPERTLLWRIVQDHIKPELLFMATEFGIYFTPDAGQHWVQLKGGLPVISFRDLAIQKHENDLVGASFGRGFYILDDYSPLREITAEKLEEEALLFEPRDAWWYIERQLLGGSPKASQGDSYFTADNPPFGVTFTVYLKADFPSLKEKRQREEKKAKKENLPISFPDWDSLAAELNEEAPKLLIQLTDEAGNYVKSLEAPNKKGINRVSWNLEKPSTAALGSVVSDWEPPSVMVAPGTYHASLVKKENGEITDLSGPVSFEVKPLRSGSLAGADPQAVVAFWDEVQALRRSTTAASRILRESKKKLALMQQALDRTAVDPAVLFQKLESLRAELDELDALLNGHPAKNSIGERTHQTVNNYLGAAMTGSSRSTYGPTPLLRESLENARILFAPLRERLDKINLEELPALAKALQEAGAPWMEGLPIPE